MIDLHCHVLPGLDDGPETLEEAIDMCRMAAADGITVLAATPHQMDGVYNTDKRDIAKGVELLQEQLDAEDIPLRLVPGGDVHLACLPGRELVLGDVMTLGDAQRYLLVEPPEFATSFILRDVLAKLREKGVVPIITHPERNLNVQLCPDLIRSLVVDGNLVQVTAGSLTGEFGGEIQRTTFELLKRRLVHFVATDAHSVEWRKPILSEARGILCEILSATEADEMLIERPRKVLAGEEIEVPKPVERKRSWWQRLME